MEVEDIIDLDHAPVVIWVKDSQGVTRRRGGKGRKKWRWSGEERRCLEKNGEDMERYGKIREWWRCFGKRRKEFREYYRRDKGWIRRRRKRVGESRNVRRTRGR